MKTYSTPNTEWMEMRLTSVILAESGEGQQGNPDDVNEGMGLAPKRAVF